MNNVSNYQSKLIKLINDLIINITEATIIKTELGRNQLIASDITPSHKKIKVIKFRPLYS